MPSVSVLVSVNATSRIVALAVKPAVGERFTSIVTVAGCEVNWSSLTVNVKLSSPPNPASAVYVTVAVVAPVVVISPSDPPDGSEAMAKVSASPSPSVPLKAISIGTPAVPATLVPCATGGCPPTKTVTVPGSDWRRPSEARNTNWSVPTKPTAGVYVTIAEFGLVRLMSPREPLDGPDSIEKKSWSPFGSLPLNETSTSSPDEVAALTSTTVGGPFWTVTRAAPVRSPTVALTSVSPKPCDVTTAVAPAGSTEATAGSTTSHAVS